MLSTGIGPVMALILSNSSMLPQQDHSESCDVNSTYHIRVLGFRVPIKRASSQNQPPPLVEGFRFAGAPRSLFGLT